MNMPQFTAEAALYQRSGQYRTGRQMIDLSLRTVSSIYLAARPGEVPIEVPGEEEVHLHSCAPGWIDIGGMCWPAPLTEPSSGGGSGASGGGSAGSGPGGGGVGGGPMTPPKKPPLIKHTKKVPPPKGYFPQVGGTCYGQKTQIAAGGDPIITDEPFKGKYVSGAGDKWLCDPEGPGDSILCNVKDVWTNGDVDYYYCYNKKPPYP